MDSAGRIDPTDVAGVNNRLLAWAAEDDAVRPVEVERVVIAENAIDALVDLVRSLGRGGPAMLVADHTPMMRGTDDLKSALAERLASVVRLVVRHLPDDDTEALCAEMEWARRLADEARDCTAIVAVGSGSITDVAKYARHLVMTGRPGGGRGGRTGERTALPLISFPTAASVTAYTSALAVLTVDGVKRTLPARAPDAVVCDLRTIADAPRAMTLAGFGDALARSVSYGDWFLAGQLGMDDGFSAVPGRLLAEAERVMISRAEQIAAADFDGIRCVTEAVLLGGMAMSVVNQTAPVSGWEHVISHFLDLVAHAEGRAPALHGAQVGVATLVAARAYERAWAEFDTNRIQTDMDASSFRCIVDREFRHLDSTGRLADEIWRGLEKKLARWNGAARARQQFVECKRCGEFDAFLRANVRPSAQVDDALARATAQRCFSDLDKPVSPATARQAVLLGHLVRSRFTFGDLLCHSGWLDGKTAAALLDDPGPL
ncbi:MAG: iron-containing alcohol dehydrogenase [Planctomycetota bacterium]|jgi:glycerol-1-phosphate dehydrogenase [NAD(P)+]